MTASSYSRKEVRADAVPAIGESPTPATALRRTSRRISGCSSCPAAARCCTSRCTSGPSPRSMSTSSAKRVRVIENASRAMWSAPGYLSASGRRRRSRSAWMGSRFNWRANRRRSRRTVAAATNGRSALCRCKTVCWAYRGGRSGDEQLVWFDREGNGWVWWATRD